MFGRQPVFGRLLVQEPSYVFDLSARAMTHKPPIAGRDPFSFEDHLGVLHALTILSVRRNPPRKLRRNPSCEEWRLPAVTSAREREGGVADRASWPRHASHCGRGTACRERGSSRRDGPIFLGNCPSIEGLFQSTWHQPADSSRRPWRWPQCDPTPEVGLVGRSALRHRSIRPEPNTSLATHAKASAKPSEAVEGMFDGEEPAAPRMPA